MPWSLKDLEPRVLQTCSRSSLSDLDWVGARGSKNERETERERESEGERKCVQDSWWASPSPQEKKTQRQTETGSERVLFGVICHRFRCLVIVFSV